LRHRVRVHVWVNYDTTETRPRLDREPSALISAKDETISVLSEQLESERQARRRADTIIAQFTQANTALAARVPELGAPQESPEATDTVEDEPERTGFRSSVGRLRKAHRDPGGAGYSVVELRMFGLPRARLNKGNMAEAATPRSLGLGRLLSARSRA
jgi:hypothetical protein